MTAAKLNPKIISDAKVFMRRGGSVACGTPQVIVVIRMFLQLQTVICVTCATASRSPQRLSQMNLLRRFATSLFLLLITCAAAAEPARVLIVIGPSKHPAGTH